MGIRKASAFRTNTPPCGLGRCFEHPDGAECSLMVLPVMMLKKNNTQERHKNIYLTFARKYISTENKARFKDDRRTFEQSSTFFSSSLPKPVLLVVFPTSGRQKRYCSPPSNITLKLTCLHAKLVSSWLGLSIPRPRGHS